MLFSLGSMTMYSPELLILQNNYERFQMLQEKACNDKRLVKGCNSFAQGDRPVSASYKSQDSEAAVTVWYSNQVG